MEPIAVIGFGLVLPGATNSAEYWLATQQGVSSIYNYDAVDPDFLVDCYSEGPVVANKTYSRLCGLVTDNTLQQAAARAQVELPAGYARIQKMLRLALDESLTSAGLLRGSQLLHGARAFLGATPDGIAEYDDALTLSQLEKAIVESAPAARRDALASAFHDVLGQGLPEQFSPATIYEEVLRDGLGQDVPVLQVDAACSSSLYAIDLAAKSLATGETGIAVCGGAFAAGIGNNCMFAQFNGLARTAIRPFDEKAEGTVFCDGAVVLLLRRLGDAIRDHNPIHGVIRGMGLSSDGKAPAVNVPVSTGQQLAIERCYARSGIDKDTIQYVEAHATSTSGDVVEFNSLKQVFDARGKSLPRILLGSNKALIGHTGWASGASSVAKVLLAFSHRTIPAQYGLAEINRKFKIEDSQFEIPRTSAIWPGNIDGQPRRAAINGFGFGGTNSHLILEEFDAAYHEDLIARTALVQHAQQCVIVGTNALFPADGKPQSRVTSQRVFREEDFVLPEGKLLLPDIREHMARAQFLAVMAADPLIAQARSKGVDPSRIGIVLAFNEKCERACAANLHIYKDRFLRAIRLGPGALELEEAAQDWYRKFEAEHLPTGPYTLAGIMPNVITGRVANLYDLKGPNFIVGDSKNHGVAAVRIAQELVRSADADLVLCGALHLERSPLKVDVNAQEGIVLFAVTTEAFAREHDLPLLAACTVTPNAADSATDRRHAA